MALFIVLMAVAGGAGLAAGSAVYPLPLGAFRPTVALSAGGIAFLLACIALYRANLLLDPHRPGPFIRCDRRTFARHIALLYHLMIFNTLTRSQVLPVPVATALYRLLGARIGRDSYVAGMLFDPEWVTIGDRVLVGHQASVIPHVNENGLMAIHPIEIGNDCTVGAGAIVLAGTVISDGAIVAAGAVVLKGSRIGQGETWGGIPAKPLGPARNGMLPCRSMPR